MRARAVTAKPYPENHNLSVITSVAEAVGTWRLFDERGHFEFLSRSSLCRHVVLHHVRAIHLIRRNSDTCTSDAFRVSSDAIVIRECALLALARTRL